MQEHAFFIHIRQRTKAFAYIKLTSLRARALLAPP